MRGPLKILFASSEAIPFSKTGGLADVSGSLPAALSSLGLDVNVVTPFHKSVSEKKLAYKLEKKNVKHPFTGKLFGFDILSFKRNGLKTYFIRKDKYFSRKGLYGNAMGDYADNALRFGFFCKAALVLAEVLALKPDIIHCNDWQTGLVPFYLKFRLKERPFFSGIKTLFTVHNLAYQGIFSKRFLAPLDVPRDFFNMENIEFHGKMSFMKSGLVYSDFISTVSRRYAEEIQLGEYGCGLEGLLKSRKGELSGILNGVDYDEWSPEKDAFLKVNYGPSSVGDKRKCKIDLLKTIGMPLKEEAPLLGFVGRLVPQKGIDLVAEIMEKLVKAGASMVILGIGSSQYNKPFGVLKKKFPENFRFFKEFNNELAHKIEAGCDMFLMPSRYEPCGLNQMYSIKYGTIPVVRATGGLDDVVVDFDSDRARGNGFKFERVSADDLFGAVKRAIGTFEKKDLWNKLMLNAMSCDFSWEHSAKEYVRLYEKIVAKG
jgi:starch synthase